MKRLILWMLLLSGVGVPTLLVLWCLDYFDDD